MIKQIKKTNRFFIVFFIVVLAISFLISCKKEEEVVEELYVPEAANQFAVDKETETSTIAETKAHHVYDEIKITPENEVVIGEKNYLTRIHYITENIEKFANSSIIIEGMFAWYESWDKTFKFPMVYRNGPGCCGDDQYGGFYLINIDQTAYEIDDWIKIKGKPFMYEHTDSEGEIQKFPFILVETIEVLSLKERKAEMVNN